MVKERAWNDEDIKSYKILVNKSKVQKKKGGGEKEDWKAIYLLRRIH